jgi:D-3-phosphoglycerate dehydrogenase
MAKLLYYEILNFRPENLALLHEHFEVMTLRDPSADDPSVLEQVEVCFAPLGHPFDAPKIDRCPRLKVIASNTTGTPHIDLHHASRKGIHVASLAGQTEFLRGVTATAELTWGLMIAVLRRIPWAFDSVLDGRWSRWPFGAPLMLSRMSLGIVGMGRLGGMVARFGLAFGMTVRYHDPRPKSPPEGAVAAATLEELVAASDVVSLHLPLDDRTRRLVDARLLERFKPGACLVNTSRGAIVDSEALLEALRTGRRGAAALDVLDDDLEQGFTQDLHRHPLVIYAREHDNLLLTPHIGGSTIDAWAMTQRRTIELVIDHLRARG